MKKKETLNKPDDNFHIESYKEGDFCKLCTEELVCIE
jgi:hypothetical protein